MPNLPMVVYELPTFRRSAKRLLDEDQVDEIVLAIATDPEAGDILEGTGGVRKRRFGLDARGKSGGVRVIYYFHGFDMPAFIITVFAKNEASNLTKAEANAMRAVVDQIVSGWRSRTA